MSRIKRKILRVTKKQRQIAYKGMPVEPTADFSLIAMDDRDREVIS